jgi:putative spermidine/putrescine transport system substrate-binding protein
VKLPQDVKARLIPDIQYKAARPVADFAAWETATRLLPREWQGRVMIKLQ